ncbi:diguanylate cyclase [Clostridium botulinum]|uniref:GGDEF domain-containing protein n=1 Tax=Clostridium botulinum TaxID=1491 RepID=A0A6B4JRU0_CLOBO|nr:diguanylate cyclase [Clostridium botulinum]EES48819.1 putative signaling protein [Clostridium botulinum E1 str. 'BoNT E Beluga']MBY6761214.1 GGDEF domain-containing protein [Clostridium botulinum]MBY6921308.1 GGDEF domain-containing protein [Clostridium botulinum]MCR1132129.1 diguanylate cyclase [Clostridium botulinum]NFJ59315.1 GGDEF domain-containing protein [Clostridium botulinum]
MNEINIRKKVDILITFLITYFFIISISFNIFNFQQSFENYFMLTLIMIIAVISYYTNVTFSLIVTLIVDFLYMSVKLYLNLTGNITVEFNTYYWIITIPITALIVSLMSKNIVLLQEKVIALEEENSRLIMIDEYTGIRNDKAIMMELPIYMNISKRHNLPLTLIMVKVKFADKLKRILGRKKYLELLVQTCDILKKALREEDVKYILNESTLAFITITNEDGAKVVKKRFRENVNNVDFIQYSLYENVKLDIQMGSCTFDKSIKDSMEFLIKAEKEIEYDIQE